MTILGGFFTETRGTKLAVANPSASASPRPASILVEFKNCSETKTAYAVLMTKTKTTEIYEFYAGLDRDKDGVTCEN